MISSDRVLEYILTFQKAYPGVSPSYRDIQTAFRIPSTSTVAKLMEELHEDNLLTPYSENIRGIVLHETALLTKEELEQLGVDWTLVESVRLQSRNELTLHTTQGEYGIAQPSS